MADPNDSPQAQPDPEIEALLQFEPVVRKCVRHDGWTAEKQREFVRALTVLGSPQQAAIAVGGTMSGAYKLRTAEGGEQFTAAWDSALALHLRRYPRPEPKGRPSRGEIQSGAGRKPWPAASASLPEPSVDRPTPEEFLKELLRIYLLKLRQERESRLAGRIVEADFYVRQLTWIEVACDIGGNALELLGILRRGEVDAMDIAATPISTLLDRARRSYWQEKGEVDRPPAPEIGEPEDAFGLGPSRHYNSARDGDMKEWEHRRAELDRINAEAQQAWEERAKAEAEAWARREPAKGGEPAEGGAGQP
jgi:hypothetical protein